MLDIPEQKIPKRLLDPEVPIFVDENVKLLDHEENSPRFIHVRDLNLDGVNDWLILEVVKERNGILITQDNGMVCRALTECCDVIYQSYWGDRFYFDGGQTVLVGRGHESQAKPKMITA